MNYLFEFIICVFNDDIETLTHDQHSTECGEHCEHY